MALPNSVPVGGRLTKRRHRVTALTIHVALCILLFGIIALPMLMSFGDYRLDRVEPLSVASFLAVGAVILGNLFYASYRRPFSINVGHWTFLLIFFFVAPFVQYLVGRVPAQVDPASYFGPYNLLEQHHLKANVCVFLWCLAYMFVYYPVARMGGVEDQPERRREAYNVLLLAAFNVLVLVFLFAFFGKALLGTRGGLGEADGLAAESSTGLTLIVGTAVRAMPFLSFILLLSIKPRSAAYFPSLVLVGGIAALLTNPIAVARFVFGASMISLICLFLRQRRVSALWIPITIVLALFTVMPLLNVGRSADISEGIQKVGLEGYTDRLLNGDFDAYGMMLNVIDYVDNGPGPRMGQGIGSAVLFLVPRNAWAERSRGSGFDIADHYRFGYGNLSCPLPAEGYFDFGVFGLMGYAMLLACTLGLLDKGYWRLQGAKKSPLLLLITYPILVGQIIIFMRGSLQPLFAYSVVVFPAAFVVIAVARAGVRRKLSPLV